MSKKLSDAALQFLINTIETTPYGKIVIDLSENFEDVMVTVEGKMKFPKPKEEIKTEIKNVSHNG